VADAGGWEKLVIGAPKQTHHAPPGTGEYGFYRLKIKKDGVTVIGEVYPDFGADRWFWGVKFPQVGELGDDHYRRERRVGGHRPTRKEAEDAAEEAIRRGRPVDSPDA
jgi:hypothetical protein